MPADIRISGNAMGILAKVQGIEDKLDDIVVGSMGEGLARAQWGATNKYMVEGGDKRSDPPNPPPGPLKKRTHTLAKAVVIRPPTITEGGKGSNTTIHTGSLDVDLDMAPYGYAHEFGARMRRAGTRMGGRNYSSKLGPRGGLKRIRATTDLAARPYMTPSMDDEFGPGMYVERRIAGGLESLALYFG